MANVALTTVEGIGLGALGIGLPDIVLFVGMLLKGIYQTAIGYGFTYDSTGERLFILRMMEAALMRNSDFEEKNAQVDNMIEGITLIGEKDLEKQLHRSSWRRCQSNLL